MKILYNFPCYTHSLSYPENYILKFSEIELTATRQPTQTLRAATPSKYLVPIGTSILTTFVAVFSPLGDQSAVTKSTDRACWLLSLSISPPNSCAVHHNTISGSGLFEVKNLLYVPLRNAVHYPLGNGLDS